MLRWPKPISLYLYHRTPSSGFCYLYFRWMKFRVYINKKFMSILKLFCFISTYWDFQIESIAWKTHTEISSSNHIAKRLSHTWEKRFIQSEISSQNESVSSQRVHGVVGASSILISFTEVCRVSTSFHWFSRELAINHRQWPKVRAGLSL